MKVSYTVGGVTFHYDTATAALEHLCFLAPELREMENTEDLERELHFADRVLTAAGRLETNRHPPKHYSAG